MSKEHFKKFSLKLLIMKNIEMYNYEIKHKSITRVLRRSRREGWKVQALPRPPKPFIHCCRWIFVNFNIHHLASGK